MSLDPAMVRAAPGADGDCRDCGGAGCHRCDARAKPLTMPRDEFDALTRVAKAAFGPVQVTRAEVLSLAEGDRLIVHVDGAAGLSGGGAQQIGQYIRAVLKLADLPYDVPILVVSPGIRVTVARPS